MLYNGPYPSLISSSEEGEMATRGYQPWFVNLATPDAWTERVSKAEI
jgi:hypothetical protein